MNRLGRESTGALLLTAVLALQGCGGGDEDRAAFAAAWRRLYMRPPR